MNKLSFLTVIGIVLFCCTHAGAGMQYQNGQYKLPDPNIWLEPADSSWDWSAHFIIASDANIADGLLRPVENDTNNMQTQLSFADFGRNLIAETGNSEMQTAQRPTSGLLKLRQHPLLQNTAFDANVDTIELGRFSEEWLREDEDVPGFCFKNDFNKERFVGLVDFTFLGSSWMAEIAVP